MPSELPSGWSKRAFGDFANESRIPGTNGLIAKKLTVKLYGRGVHAKIERAPGSPNTKYFIRRAGQLLYSKLDFLNGAFGLVPDELDGRESTADLPAFDLSRDVHPKWLLEYVSRPEFYERMGMGAIGSRKARRVSPAEFRKLKLLVPPLPEQKKIAAILSSVDEAIQATQAVIEQTRRVKEGLLQDLLTKGIGPGGVPHTRFKQTEIGEIPESWEALGLFTLADLQHGKAFPSSDYGNEGVLLVRPGNLHADNMVLWDEEHTTRLPTLHWQESPDHRVGPNEVLMNLTAQSLADNFLGRVCMTPPDNQCLLNQRIGRVTPRRHVTNDFLFWVLQGPQFRDHIRTRGQGSKVQHLYNRDLETSVLPVPPVDEQRAISKAMWDARDAVVQQVKLLERLVQVKAGLLQDLLTGKVRVSV